MPSFGEGFAKGLSGQLEARNSAMLQLQMLSKRIEMETQAHEQEMEQAHQYTLLPQGAASAALKTLGVSQDKLDLLDQAFPEGVPEATLGALTSALGMQARANAMVDRPTHVITKPDHNNLVTAGFQEPLTGQWLGQPQTTLDPLAERELNKVDDTAQNGINMVSGILQRGQQVLPDAPAGVPINKLDTYWQQHGMPTNPALKAFQDSMGALSAQYIKDTTGMAPRSLELMQLDQAAFPNPSDTVQSATQKAQILQQVLQNKAATAHTFYDPTNFMQSQFHPKAQGQQIGQQAADANQLHTTSKGTKYIVSQ